MPGLLLQTIALSPFSIKTALSCSSGIISEIVPMATSSKKLLLVLSCIACASLLLAGCNRNQKPQPTPALEAGPALVQPQPQQPAAQQPAADQSATPAVKYMQPPVMQKPVEGPVQPMHPNMAPAHPAITPNQSPMNGSVVKPEMVPPQPPVVQQPQQPQLPVNNQ